MVILLGFKVFVDFGHVGHDLLPVWSLNVGHFHDALKTQQRQNSFQTKVCGELTRVVGIPTLSAAEKATEKFFLLSVGTSLS
jgi:hypothetical protein